MKLTGAGSEDGVLEGGARDYLTGCKSKHIRQGAAHPEGEMELHASEQRKRECGWAAESTRYGPPDETDDECIGRGEDEANWKKGF